MILIAGYGILARTPEQDTLLQKGNGNLPNNLTTDEVIELLDKKNELWRKVWQNGERV